MTIIDSVIDSYQKLSNIENNNDINIYIFIFNTHALANNLVSKLNRFLEIEWIKYQTRNRKIKLKDINNCFRKNNCFFFFLVVY